MGLVELTQEIAKRKRETGRGGGTGAAIGGGLAAAGLAAGALKVRKPIKAAGGVRGLIDEARRDEGHAVAMSNKQYRRVKLAGAAVASVPVATSAGYGSAVGAGIGRKRRSPGAELAGMQKNHSEANTVTNVQWVQPRHRETGRFVSHANDLKIFHPKGRSGGSSGGRANALEHYGKKPSLVGKGLEFGNTGKIGRRLLPNKPVTEYAAKVRAKGMEAGSRINRGQPSSPVRAPYKTSRYS